MTQNEEMYSTIDDEFVYKLTLDELLAAFFQKPASTLQ
jgi:hypothetical protein